jgi:hypothetical protein
MTPGDPDAGGYPGAPDAGETDTETAREPAAPEPDDRGPAAPGSPAAS